jgi:hypothetical protein
MSNCSFTIVAFLWIHYTHQRSDAVCTPMEGFRNGIVCAGVKSEYLQVLFVSTLYRS